MTPPVDPSLNRRKLRLALRQARERVGLTQREAAERVEWSQSKLIRVETGTVSVSVSDLRALMTLYGLTDDTVVGELEEAARGSKGPSWWSSFHDVLTPSSPSTWGTRAPRPPCTRTTPSSSPGICRPATTRQRCSHREASSPAGPSAWSS